MRRAPMPEAAVPPIRKEILVQGEPWHVFRVFTERIDAWWPRTYKIGPAALKQVVLEARLHGRLYEIGADGSECDWGKVLLWEPPVRLVLAWQITGEWRYDPAFVTELQLTFAAQGANATKVVLEHRDLERYGGVAARLEPGWTGLLNTFAKAAAWRDQDSQ